jgi:hypothetical protein
MTQQGYAGYIIISRETPIKALRLYANLVDDSVKEGDVVTIVTRTGDPIAIGVITGIEVLSLLDRFELAALSTTLSSAPELEALTKIKALHKATINILLRLKNLPLEQAYAIKIPEKNDIEELWRSLISEERKRVLAGFLKGAEPLLAYYHADFLLGPEGAHLNVGGISGLAAKTSYLRFLVYSLLEYMERTNLDIRIIAFNVKRLDFLGLHKIPDKKEDVDVCIDDWGKRRGINQEVLDMYKKMYSYLFNAIRNYRDNIMYFTYRDDPYRNDEKFMLNPQIYEYGLLDLGIDGLVAGLFEEEDEASILQINLLAKVYSVAKENGWSFNDLKILLELLQDECEVKSPRRDIIQECRNIKQQVLVHPQTVAALIRRLDGFITRAEHILSLDKPSSNPMRAESFKKGINIVQLYGLSEIEKRVILTSVINDVLKDAEEKQRQGTDKVYIIIVDELNKYAPTARTPIKASLIEIAARGRDLRVSLFGAEQFPSDVDGQILGNTGTLVIGRSAPTELEDRSYRVFGELKTVAERLGKGEVLVYHPIHLQPLILMFPPPLNDVMRECGRY